MSSSSASANTQASSNSTSELTEEEKKFDVDGDGALSATEKAAYLEAQAKEKKRESAEQSAHLDGLTTVNISDEARKLQKQGRSEGSPQGLPSGQLPNANEMSGDDLKSLIDHMKDINGHPPKDLSSYSEADIDSLSVADIKQTKEIMTQMQEKSAKRANEQTGKEQQLLINQAIAAYNNFK